MLFDNHNNNNNNNNKFNRQAVARVGGDTARRRINPTVLLNLRIIVPPKELQKRIGAAVEREIAPERS